jgi:hypothetical protein
MLLAGLNPAWSFALPERRGPVGELDPQPEPEAAPA